MKKFLALSVICFSTSCSFDRYSKSQELAEIKIHMPPQLVSEKSGPGDYGTIDCFLLDVNGPGIDKMYPQDSPFEAMDLGLNSPWFSRAELVAAGTTSLSIRVPVGRSRTVRILGATGVNGACSAQTFSGYPNNGVLALPPYPIINELARATLDVFSGRAVATAELADRSEDILPSSTLTAAGRAGFSAANSLSDYSEGGPGAAAFGPWSVPFSTGGRNGKARLDIVLDLDNLNLTSYRGLQIRIKAVGGTSACIAGSPAVTAASPLSLGLWNEGGLRWEIKTTAIPAIGQDQIYTLNFTGIDLQSAITSVDDGTAFDALYLSLRVEDAQAGCSTIQVSDFSALLYQ